MADGNETGALFQLFTVKSEVDSLKLKIKLFSLVLDIAAPTDFEVEPCYFEADKNCRHITWIQVFND